MDGEQDHVHLLILYPPKLSISVMHLVCYDYKIRTLQGRAKAPPYGLAHTLLALLTVRQLKY